MWFLIKQFVTNMFGYPLSLFSRLLDRVPNGLQVFVGVFMFYCFCRFILRPMLGGTFVRNLGSDRVRHVDSKKYDEGVD